MPEIKFTDRLEEHLAYYKETAKISNGENSIHIHIFLEIDGWIGQDTGEYGNQPSSSYFHENDERTSYFFTKRRKCAISCCKTRKDMQLTWESSSPGTLCTLVLVQKILGNLKGTQGTQKESEMNFQNK